MARRLRRTRHGPLDLCAAWKCGQILKNLVEIDVHGELAKKLWECTGGIGISNRTKVQRDLVITPCGPRVRQTALRGSKITDAATCSCRLAVCEDKIAIMIP